MFDNDITDHHSGLDNAKYPIPASMEWANLSWDLFACSIFSGSLNAGHYTSMMRNGIDGKYTLYNDDFVTTHRPRSALQGLQNNKYGLVYGLVYVKT